MVLAWENLQEVFVMLAVVVVFDLTGFFYFHCFSISSVILLLPIDRFFTPIFTGSATVFSKLFLPTGIFYPTFLHFVTQMWAGPSHPRCSSVPAFTELSLPADTWTWTIDVWVTRPLIYRSHQWATKHRVKIGLLNMFCLFKVIYRDY